MKYSNSKIQDKFNHGENLKFLFFWGHQPNKDGSVGKVVLVNGGNQIL